MPSPRPGPKYTPAEGRPQTRDQQEESHLGKALKRRRRPCSLQHGADCSGDGDGESSDSKEKHHFLQSAAPAAGKPTPSHPDASENPMHDSQFPELPKS